MSRKYNYSRRPTVTVSVGGTAIGGTNPIRIQSMNNTSTLDTEASAQQAARIAEAGGEIVRLTTQGVREAANMAAIKERMHELGCRVPLVADVHFNPNAAFEAAKTCDKVRINPGNFVDAARTFRKLEYTDEEYADEIERIRHSLLPFLQLCREHGTAVRLGVNHGSLSDRIMSRYGDTPEGMVESVMEYLRIAREVDFNDIVISIKASNTVVMTRTVRLLVEQMDKEDMHFPLHLGVTEAGDGEDGRIKSAVGIGALLAEGLGDTIRVSLSEPPENEIPVAVALRDYIVSREGHDPVIEPKEKLPGDERDYSVMPKDRNGNTMGPIAWHTDWERIDNNTHFLHALASTDEDAPDQKTVVLLTSSHSNPVGEIKAWLDEFRVAGNRNPVVIQLVYDSESDKDLVKLKAAADAGALLLDGYGCGIRIESTALTLNELRQLELDILQATRMRMSKTEYIACPGCGRTLFDLQTTLHEVKKATSHLKGLKIGVMGCIVNGPGEMADADYGYVGAGPGRVSIYRGKELVIKNIPTDEALPRLMQLIESDAAASL